MLLKVSNFTYATALDLVMGYNNIELSDYAKKLWCTITTPFGQYEYNRLPMGVSISPRFPGPNLSTFQRLRNVMGVH